MNEASTAEISPDRMGAVLSSPFRIAPLINRASIPASKLPIRPEPSAGLRYHLPAERRELRGGHRARVSGDPELSTAGGAGGNSGERRAPVEIIDGKDTDGSIRRRQHGRATDAHEAAHRRDLLGILLNQHGLMPVEETHLNGGGVGRPGDVELSPA